MAMSTLTGQGAWRTKPYAVSPMPQAVIDAALGTFSTPASAVIGDVRGLG